MIDASGALVSHLPRLVAGTIRGILPPAHVPPAFALYGNLLSFLFAAFLLLLAIASRRFAR